MPSARNVDSNTVEKTTVIFKAKLIFDLISSLFFSDSFFMLIECSLMLGISVTASEPMSVDGIMIKGNVMPIIIPNSERASVEEYPNVMSLIGMMIEIKEETTDETVFAAVIGELDFSICLNSA